MEYFKEAEAVLYSVPKKEEAIKQMTRRKNRLIKRMGPSMPHGTDFFSSYTKAAFYGAINEICELADLISSIENMETELAEIRACVEAIEDATLRKLLKCWYWARLPKEKIAEKIDCWSTTTVYTKRNKAVEAFALLYWGKRVDAELKKSGRKN